MAWGLRRETRTLAAIRDELLPKLVSGRIRLALSDDSKKRLGEDIEAHQAEATA